MLAKEVRGLKLFNLNSRCMQHGCSQQPPCSHACLLLAPSLLPGCMRILFLHPNPAPANPALPLTLRIPLPHSLLVQMKCTAKENDLLKQLLNSAATQATTGAGCDGLPANAAAMPLGLLPPGLDSAASGSQDLLGCGSSFPLRPASSLVPATQDPESSLLMPAKGSGAHAAVVAAPGGTPSCPPASCPASPLPPSPFASPKRPLAPRSPSKPLTPQRLALRSPFAAAPQERGPSRLSMLSGSAAGGADLPAAAPAPICPSSKVLLLEQLATGAAPLQQAVARALLQRLQQQHEAELCGRGPAWAQEEQVSDEEAAQIAAMALQHSLVRGNAVCGWWVGCVQQQGLAPALQRSGAHRARWEHAVLYWLCLEPGYALSLVTP